MAFAPPVAGLLVDRQNPQKVTSQFGNHVHSHSTARPQAAHQCRLEHQLGRSRATWGSNALHSKQQQSSRQKRGHSAVVYADQDYYSVLGISKTADKQAIKSAYRQKARKFHPDVNKEPGAEDTFKSISNAYEVLSDEQKRGIYDRLASPCMLQEQCIHAYCHAYFASQCAPLFRAALPILCCSCLVQSMPSNLASTSLNEHCRSSAQVTFVTFLQLHQMWTKCFAVNHTF